ncbi:hypothetical protein [uncultured Thalassospira sp.]|uniref:hypothetical protein n=1 Tax=uncultured Thalassospira sp. TaxID=404382 RepID=UPI0030DD731C|tara:strand:+ start:2830 stop:3339 length:510 start_codon:yes stop_codon:yes gene_type:complete
MLLRPIMSLFLCLAVPSLGACGFHPLYGQNNAGEATSDALSKVKIDLIENRVGQLTRNVLLENLTPKGSPTNAEYELVVELNESTTDLGFTKQNEATISDYILSGNYKLIRISDTKTMRSGTLRARTSFNIVQSDFASLEAKSAAREDAARNLARQIANQVAIGVNNAD